MKRLVVGLFEGTIVGLLAAFALMRAGFGTGFAVMYGAAALVGGLVGLVAGRPIWARDAKLEAGLKSLVGAFVAVTALYGVRKWLGGVHVDLGFAGAGSGSVGELPAAALPLIGAGLALAFEVDDAFGSGSEPGTKTRVDAGSSGDDAELRDEEEASDERRRSRGEN